MWGIYKAKRKLGGLGQYRRDVLKTAGTVVIEFWRRKGGRKASSKGQSRQKKVSCNAG